VFFILWRKTEFTFVFPLEGSVLNMLWVWFLTILIFSIAGLFFWSVALDQLMGEIGKARRDPRIMFVLLGWIGVVSINILFLWATIVSIIATVKSTMVAAIKLWRHWNT